MWNLTNALLKYREVLKESIQNIIDDDHTDDFVAVIGGDASGWSSPRTEILDFSGRNRMCDLTKAVSRDAFGGAVFNDQILICGGKSRYCLYGDDVDALKSRSARALSYKRTYASIVPVNSTMLWVVGGLKTKPFGYDTTDFVHLNNKKTVKGPKLPILVVYHCMVDLEDGSFLLIGGRQNGIVSSQTWILNPSDISLTKEGPPLSMERYFHACGTMKDKYGNLIIVTAGGRDKNYLNTKSVEMLNTTLMKEWNFGKLINNSTYPFETSK